MRVNPSPRVLDSAVIELHFIRTAYLGHSLAPKRTTEVCEGVLGIGPDEL